MRRGRPRRTLLLVDVGAEGGFWVVATDYESDSGAAQQGRAAGPARAGIWVRSRLAPVLREHPAFIYGAVAFALLFVLLTGSTDGQRIYPLLVVFGLAFVGTEVLRKQTLREFPAG